MSTHDPRPLQRSDARRSLRCTVTPSDRATHGSDGETPPPRRYVGMATSEPRTYTRRSHARRRVETA